MYTVGIGCIIHFGRNTFSLPTTESPQISDSDGFSCHPFVCGSKLLENNAPVGFVIELVNNINILYARNQYEIKPVNDMSYSESKELTFIEKKVIHAYEVQAVDCSSFSIIIVSRFFLN